MRGEMILDTRTACGEFVLPRTDKIPDIALRTIRQTEAWRGKMTPAIYAALRGISIATAREWMSGNRPPLSPGRPDKPVGSASSATPVRRGRPVGHANIGDADQATAVLDATAEVFSVTTGHILAHHKQDRNLNAARAAAFALVYEQLRPRVSYRGVAAMMNGRSDQSIYNAIRAHGQGMERPEYRRKIEAILAALA